MLADDHHVVREGLRVTGEAKNGREVADIAERLKPHVLVLDLMMPGLNGLEIICQVCRRAPATRIVVLSMYADAAYGVQALRNGAPAYVLKSANAGEIVKAVRKAMAGRRYLSPGALPAGRPGLRREDPGRRARHVRDADLARTGVLHLAAEGHGNPEIAARLAISVRTAETHRANLMRKLGLRNQTDVVRYARRRGLLRNPNSLSIR